MTEWTREKLQALMDGKLQPQHKKPVALRKGARKPTEPRGYAGTPGQGPAGESCGSCANIMRVHLAKTYLKCGVFPARTGGPGTDIRAGSPACEHWTRT